MWQWRLANTGAMQRGSTSSPYCALGGWSPMQRGSRAWQKHPPERSTSLQTADTASASEVAASWQRIMKLVKMKNLLASGCSTQWGSSKQSPLSI